MFNLLLFILLSVDGVYPGMAMATSGGKILIHTPFNASNEEEIQGTKGLGIAANFAHNQA